MSSHRPINRVAFVAILLFASTAPASDIGQWVADQVDLANYRHYLDDLLYTHDGNNRGSGTPDHIAARANIIARFTAFDLQVEVQQFIYGGNNGYNVVATQVGTLHPDSYYVIGAHYDSADNPGADDNASGVAGVMETARILSQCPTGYTIKYIAFDMEEWGVIGSEAYVDSHFGDDIRGMVSLDMIAYNSGPDQCEISSWYSTVGLALRAAIEVYSGGLTIAPPGDGGGSDHMPFLEAGYDACLLIEPDVYTSNPCYHEGCDSVDTPNYIDYEYAVKMTRSVGGFLADNAMAALPWDCNHNGVPDTDEIQADPSLDCNDNGRLDECEPFGGDCDGNGTPDLCDMLNGASTDCQPDQIPDQCQLQNNDCNANTVPDECDITQGTSVDCQPDGIPDECQLPDNDCNANAIPDECDIAQGTSVDLNANGVPDECEPHETWYVDAANCPGPGSGSEADPFCTIQAGIDAASDGFSALVEIIVADGTYTGAGNKNIDFGGKAVTLRSQHGAANCIIDCEGSGRGFYFHSGETAGARVDGFTIRNGFADVNAAGGAYGGAVQCSSSSPTLANCTITGNSATNGGGISCSSSANPTLTNCTLSENSAFSYGGGAFCLSSLPSVSNCTISDNTASNGGGMYCHRAALALTECTVERNTASSYGGGLYCDWASPKVANCLVHANTATYSGGGVYCYDSSCPTMTNCTIRNNVTFSCGGGVSCSDLSVPTLTDCAIYGNTALDAGGGVYTDRSRPRLINCAILGNSASSGGGLYHWGCYSYFWLELTNCTISGNVAVCGAGLYSNHSGAKLANCILWGDSPDEMLFTGSYSPIVSYCDVQGGWNGTGNINADPQFVDPDGPDNDPATWEDNDYHLRLRSPCVNAGDPAGNYTGQTDMDGQERVMGGRVDMGADEFLIGVEAPDPAPMPMPAKGGIVSPRPRP